MNNRIILSCALIPSLFSLHASEVKRAKVDTNDYLRDVMNDKYEEVKYHLEQGVPIDAYNEDGSALYLAVRGAHSLEITKLLLKHGAAVDKGSTKGHFTPLMVAIEFGLEEIFDLLMEYNADVTKENEDGYSPLHYAAAFGHTNMAQRLLEKGASFKEATDGVTPLLLATVNEHDEMIKLFLQQNPAPEIGRGFETLTRKVSTHLVNKIIRCTAALLSKKASTTQES